MDSPPPGACSPWSCSATELPTAGWTPLTYTAAVATLGLGTVFAVNQRRHPAPILPPQLLRIRQVRTGVAANALVGASHVPAFVLLSLMLQQAMGYSALAAGFAVLPIAAVNMVTARTALPWAMGRFGSRVVLAAGMFLLALGLAGYAILLHPGAGYLTAVLPASLIFAVGLPAVFVGSTAPAVRSAPESQQGVAAGLVNTAQRLGAALGLTALLMASTAWTTNRGSGDGASALADGLRIGFAGAAGLAVLGILCALSMGTREPKKPASGDTPQQEAIAR